MEQQRNGFQKINKEREREKERERGINVAKNRSEFKLLVMPKTRIGRLENGYWFELMAG